MIFDMKWLQNGFQNVGKGKGFLGDNPLGSLFGGDKGAGGWGATVQKPGEWNKWNAEGGGWGGLTDEGKAGWKGIGDSMQMLGGAIGGGTGMPAPQMPQAGPQPAQQAMQMASPAAAFNAGQSAVGGMPASNQNSAVGQGMERRAAFEDPRRRMMRRG